MDEQSCPRCKTNSYRNKSLKLLVNVCGHKLCQTCVDVLFTRPSAACPQCNTPLRRSDFRNQQFEDASVEREVDIRRKIVKIYNKREDEFSTLKEFNDYLEEIEDVIFNLANKVDVEETKKKVDAYKRENEKVIRKNNSKLDKGTSQDVDVKNQSQEEAMMKALLESERLEKEEKLQQLINEKNDTVLQKKKEKESLINDLIYANAPADEVIARHLSVKRQQEQEAQEKKSFFFSEKNKLRSMNQVHKPIIETPLFHYEEPKREWFGPKPPEDEEILKSDYLKYIRPAAPSEKAGGYHESLACKRALQEAFDCLYL